MITKKLKKLRHTKLWATGINLILIAIIINIIVHLIPISIDLTSNKTHSLTATTKKILVDLDDIVTIKAFVSGNLPLELTPLKKILKNTLSQYQKSSKGKVKLIWLDPQKDEALQEEAISLGITPLQFSSVKEDKFEVIQGYFGLVIFYAGEKQTIPALQEINNLEYHLTATIKKMQKEALPKIAFSAGLGEIDQLQLRQINKLLQLNYQVSTLDLSQESVKLDETIETLIVAGPKEEFSQEAKLIIDQLLMNQKGVILLLDKVFVGEGLMSTEINNNLDDLLDHFGINVNKNLVVDSSAAFATFRTEQGAFMTPYPFWVKTRSENASHNLPPTASLESVVFPWVSSLKLDKEAKALWQSTPKAVITSGFNNLSPTKKWSFAGENNDQFILAAIQTNQFDSLFAKEKPKNLEKLDITEFKNKTDAVKLAVVGDANFIEDQTVTSSPENAHFLLNLVDYLSADIQLISIRSKTVFSRPLKQITEKEKQTFKIIGLAGGPVILLALATLVRWKRKKHG